MESQFVGFHLGHAYVQEQLLTFTRRVLELEPVVRLRALAKIRPLEESFLSRLANPCPL